MIMIRRKILLIQQFFIADRVHVAEIFLSYTYIRAQYYASQRTQQNSKTVHHVLLWFVWHGCQPLRLHKVQATIFGKQWCIAEDFKVTFVVHQDAVRKLHWRNREVH